MLSVGDAPFIMPLPEPYSGGVARRLMPALALNQYDPSA